MTAGARADAYYMNDEYERAIEDYDAAIGLDGTTMPTRTTAGVGRTCRLDDMPAAMADLNKALELGYDSDEIEAALAEFRKIAESEP